MNGFLKFDLSQHAAMKMFFFKFDTCIFVVK